MGDGTEQAGDGLKPGEVEDLAAIRWNWGDAYEIEVADGLWRAKRRDWLGVWFTAPDAEGLAMLIREDYAAKPVSRDAGRQR